jgi:hypothetical protein
MKQFALNVFLAAVVLIGLSNLSSHALSTEANQPKENQSTPQLTRDQYIRSLTNYYIDANGNVVDLQPYLDHESSAINRMNLSESQPTETEDKDCEANQ